MEGKAYPVWIVDIQAILFDSTLCSYVICLYIPLLS